MAVPERKIGQLHAAQRRVSQRDPTRTGTIRRAFLGDVGRRFRKLKGVIRKSIVDEDCFDLTPSVLEPRPTRRKQFKFTRVADKITGFMSWLDDQEDAGILEVTRRPGIRPGLEEAWSDVYIRSAYQRGMQRGREEMRKAGWDVPTFDREAGGLSAVFNRPFHADRVGALYTRAFQELKGIDAAMDQGISRVLAEGLAIGVNPRELAKTLNNRVDHIGLYRARMLARTETARAHHVATIEEYRQAGVEGIRVKAEWLTAGYDVCPRCESLEGRTFTLSQIEGMIPYHPN